MDIHASAKFLRISPKKARPLAAVLRGMVVPTALRQLHYHPTKAAKLFHKLIHAASSNAQNNYNFKLDNLKIKTLTVDSGPTFKRYWFRSRGNADRLLKRTSHLQVTLTEIKPTVVKKVVAKPKTVTTPTDKPVESTQSPAAAGGAPVDHSARGIKPKGGLKRIFTPRTTNK